MGIQMKLPKEDNILYTEFLAYWSIDQIIFSNSGGLSYCSWNFDAYPSREAKQMNLKPVALTLGHGGAMGIAYSPKLHTEQECLPTSEVFPDGIPSTEKEQKGIIYAYVKKDLGLIDYTDIIE